MEWSQLWNDGCGAGALTKNRKLQLVVYTGMSYMTRYKRYEIDHCHNPILFVSMPFHQISNIFSKILQIIPFFTCGLLPKINLQSDLTISSFCEFGPMIRFKFL